MNQAIERRAMKEAAYIIAAGATVRETARVVGVSKSTVHKDVTVRLLQLSPTLHEAVARVLMRNRAERHLRGGEATRRRYEQLRRGRP